MAASVSIKIDQRQFEQALKKALTRELNGRVQRAVPKIRGQLVDLVTRVFTGSAVYTSLQTGLLRGEFGLSNPDAALNSILNLLQSSVKVTANAISYRGDKISGGITFELINPIQDLLALPEASYTSNQFVVKWLDWLLTKGSSIIVADYHIDYNLEALEKARSRSGVALMKAGGGWRVPKGYRGVEGDNWITQTFDLKKIGKDITNIIESSL